MRILIKTLLILLVSVPYFSMGRGRAVKPRASDAAFTGGGSVNPAVVKAAGKANCTGGCQSGVAQATASSKQVEQAVENVAGSTVSNASKRSLKEVFVRLPRLVVNAGQTMTVALVNAAKGSGTWGKKAQENLKEFTTVASIKGTAVAVAKVFGLTGRAGKNKQEEIKDACK